MVTDALRPLFEKEGLSLIPPAVGAKLVVDFARNDSEGPVEIVVLAERQTVDGTAASSRKPSPAADRRLETVLRHSVDVDSLLILNSHIIDGHPVLPMAIILEWLAEGATQRNPGLVVAGLDNFVLYKGVILSDQQAVRVEIKAGKAVRSGKEFTVPVELWGTLANGRDVTHARADVVLADRHATGSRKLPNAGLSAYPLTRDEIYQTVLFHGPAMQGIERVEGLALRTVSGWVSAAPSPSEWVERPLRSSWLTDPLAVDCAFQLVVLWCRDQLGANSLPTAVGSYRQFRQKFPTDGVHVHAEIKQASDARAVADIEFLDATGELVARLDSYECVVDASLNQAFLRNHLAPLLTLSRVD